MEEGGIDGTDVRAKMQMRRCFFFFFFLLVTFTERKKDLILMFKS